MNPPETRPPTRGDGSPGHPTDSSASPASRRPRQESDSSGASAQSSILSTTHLVCSSTSSDQTSIETHRHHNVPSTLQETMETWWQLQAEKLRIQQAEAVRLEEQTRGRDRQPRWTHTPLILPTPVMTEEQREATSQLERETEEADERRRHETPQSSDIMPVVTIDDYLTTEPTLEVGAGAGEPPAPVVHDIESTPELPMELELLPESPTIVEPEDESLSEGSLWTDKDFDIDSTSVHPTEKPPTPPLREPPHPGSWSSQPEKAGVTVTEPTQPGNVLKSRVQEEPDNDLDADSGGVSTALEEWVDEETHGSISNRNRDRIRRHLQQNDLAEPEDLKLHDYKGYNIEAPKIQLIRAKNFLASQHPTNTHNWDKKFDELCQYTKHLYDNYENEDWDDDLLEVIKKLQAHRIWEKYMFSPPKLNLDIYGGKGTIYPGPTRFRYNRDSIVYFEKRYRPPGASRLDHERGSLAGKSPGLFIHLPRAEKTPADAHTDPFAYTKGMAWYTEQEQKWVQWTAEHAVKEAYGHKVWRKRKEAIMPLPPAANWNGPLVNIFMDKKMHKTFEKIKQYEGLVAKLRRTVWKTAVYGERKVLKKCLEGVDHGLSTGRTWTAFTDVPGKKNPADEAKEAREKLPIRPAEYDWLEFLTCTAPHDTTLVEREPKKAVFLQRLQKLLANPRGDGVFAKYARQMTRTPIGELTNAFNFGLKRGDVQRGPKRLYIFDEEEVWEYAGLAEDLGLVHRVEEKGAFGQSVRGIGEATVRGLLPEERIRWALPGAPEEVKQTQQQDDGDGEKEEEEEDDDDTASIASTVFTAISIPASEPDYGDYTNCLPKLTSLLPWTPQDDKDQQTSSDKRKTRKFFLRLGARLGLELHNLRKDLWEMEREMYMNHPNADDPKKDTIAENPAFLLDTLGFWTDDYNKRTRSHKNPAAQGKRQTPLFKDIVEIADPKSHNRKWQNKDSWADKEEFDAREMVRQGIIRENHENKTNIWPACEDISSEPGSKFPSWRREPLWEFGNPGLRGFKVRRLFSINRWPVHLQSEETQEEIRNSGPPVKRPEHKTEKLRGLGVPYEPTWFPTKDDKTFWVPGNEYWLGATPRQQREIWRRTHLPDHSPVAQTWKDRLTSLFTRKRKRDEQDDIDSSEAGSLRLPSPKYLPKMIENRNAVERRAKMARSSG